MARKRGSEEDSRVAGSAAAAAAMGTNTLALLREVRRLVRHERIVGCRRVSRSDLLTAPVVQSSEVDRRVPCLDSGRCMRLMKGRPAVPGFVVCAARRVAA